MVHIQPENFQKCLKNAYLAKSSGSQWVSIICNSFSTRKKKKHIPCDTHRGNFVSLHFPLAHRIFLAPLSL